MIALRDFTRTYERKWRGGDPEMERRGAMMPLGPSFSPKWYHLMICGGQDMVFVSLGHCGGLA